MLEVGPSTAAWNFIVFFSRAAAVGGIAPVAEHVVREKSRWAVHPHVIQPSTKRVPCRPPREQSKRL